MEKGQTAITGVLDVEMYTQQRTIPFREWQQPFYVQLWHHPGEAERGSAFGFAAWTGELASNIIAVTDRK